MVHPIIRSNPYLRSVRTSPFPSDGKEVKLITCPKCTMMGVPIVHAPYTKAYATQCIKCGSVHAIRSPDRTSWHDVQMRGAREELPRKNVGRRSEYVDATKRVNIETRKRELGRAYWRNPD